MTTDEFIKEMDELKKEVNDDKMKRFLHKLYLDGKIDLYEFVEITNELGFSLKESWIAKEKAKIKLKVC